MWEETTNLAPWKESKHRDGEISPNRRWEAIRGEQPRYGEVITFRRRNYSFHPQGVGWRILLGKERRKIGLAIGSFQLHEDKKGSN